VLLRRLAKEVGHLIACASVDIHFGLAARDLSRQLLGDAIFQGQQDPFERFILHPKQMTLIQIEEHLQDAARGDSNVHGIARSIRSFGRHGKAVDVEEQTSWNLTLVSRRSALLQIMGKSRQWMSSHSKILSNKDVREAVQPIKSFVSSHSPSKKRKFELDSTEAAANTERNQKLRLDLEALEEMTRFTQDTLPDELTKCLAL
jgi:hypothetical protein